MDDHALLTSQSLLDSTVAGATTVLAVVLAAAAIIAGGVRHRRSHVHGVLPAQSWLDVQSSHPKGCAEEAEANKSQLGETSEVATTCTDTALQSDGCDDAAAEAEQAEGVTEESAPLSASHAEMVPPSNSERRAYESLAWVCQARRAGRRLVPASHAQEGQCYPSCASSTQTMGRCASPTPSQWSTVVRFTGIDFPKKANNEYLDKLLSGSYVLA